MIHRDRSASHGPRHGAVVGFGVLALALLVGAGGWWLGRASADASSGSAVDAVMVPDATVSSTTTSTIPHQIAGVRLPAGPATVYVLGDSVILGAESRIPAALAGWDLTFDAKVSRRIDQGIDIVAAHPTPIARVLVVHLCSNWSGGDYRAAAARLLDAARGVERVVWLTCSPWRPEVAAADEVIRRLALEDPRVVVADWDVIDDGPGYLSGDRLHLDAPGARAMASLVAGTVGPAPAPD